MEDSMPVMLMWLTVTQCTILAISAAVAIRWQLEAMKGPVNLREPQKPELRVIMGGKLIGLKH